MPQLPFIQELGPKNVSLKETRADSKNESEGVTRLLLENLGSMTRFFLSSIRSPFQPSPSSFLLRHFARVAVERDEEEKEDHEIGSQ